MYESLLVNDFDHCREMTVTCVEIVKSYFLHFAYTYAYCSRVVRLIVLIGVYDQKNAFCIWVVLNSHQSQSDTCSQKYAVLT